ncbi:ABC transporter ATP-binding protein [uncultured Peptoniphilus sp.]|uniref:ABC transporter ATP-binding protein n=1 Tax=uncultured Peptoniphilus sp. TaxID=254354 RepID=UPI0028045BD2|nr:ABC transporter ATP-binding protein [uncultured Peptoniphilus sp.]
MLEIKNLTKKFGDKVAVDNIDLSVKSGEIYGFLGPNGAGKTTTIKMIVGMLMPDGGSISVDGIDAINDDVEAKRQIAYVPDSPEIYDIMTGRQYLNFIADVFELSDEERNKQIDRYAEVFEMKENLDVMIAGYSHGMKQKIVIMGALIHSPKLLILDEPMVGLDAKSSFRLKEIMRALANEGRTVFFSTHVMEVAENLCDRIGIINRGKIIAVGTLDEIKAAAKDTGSLEKIFLELTDDRA